MQWIVDHAWWLAGYVVIAILAMERKRMWDDLRPKHFRYTWKGIYYVVMTVVTIIMVGRLIGIIANSEPIVRALGNIFLSLLGCIAAVAIICLYVCGKLDKRVTAIEKHLASPAMPSQPNN